MKDLDKNLYMNCVLQWISGYSFYIEVLCDSQAEPFSYRLQCLLIKKQDFWFCNFLMSTCSKEWHEHKHLVLGQSRIKDEVFFFFLKKKDEVK